MKPWRMFFVAASAAAVSAPLVIGCEVPVAQPPSGEEEILSSEDVGQSEDEITEASCKDYKKKFGCRKEPPKRCNKMGMPNGEGWDRCKWKDPKWNPPADPPNCAKDKGLKCPAPPKNSDGSACFKAIFGRFKDSQKYYGCPGYIVINLPSSDWDINVNNYYEDCILFGEIPNLCEDPMIFVSPTADIPDYDPAIPAGDEHKHPGQITSAEFCRALVCHECKMKGRPGGGYTPKDCKHFKKPAPPPPAAPGKMRKKPGGAKKVAMTSGPLLTCDVSEYECVPCDAPEPAPADEMLTALDATALGAGEALLAEQAIALEGGGGTGGAGAGGGGAGGDGPWEPDPVFEEGICGSCDMAAPFVADDVCVSGEEGEDCECVEDEYDLLDDLEYEEAGGGGSGGGGSGGAGGGPTTATLTSTTLEPTPVPGAD